MAVDNEPEPFWEGNDEAERITDWRDRVGFKSKWGIVGPVGKLNGSSGRWVTSKVLEPLGTDRSDTWITDCLDTYRCSGALNRALRDRFVPFAEQEGLDPLLLPDLPDHPSEAAIVREARDDHVGRLRGEIAIAQPTILVTLGNAALRVMREVVDDSSGIRKKLVADDSYGAPHTVAVAGHALSWYRLAHPAAPRAYQDVHDHWAGHRG